jgi:hypothetical protein
MKDENPEVTFPISLCPTICEIRCLPAVAGNPRLTELLRDFHTELFGKEGPAVGGFLG